MLDYLLNFGILSCVVLAALNLCVFLLHMLVAESDPSPMSPLSEDEAEPLRPLRPAKRRCLARSGRAI